MKLFSCILSAIFFQVYLGAQERLHQVNWQQKADFNIQVELKSGMESEGGNWYLDGQWQMRYFNNSPDTLYRIWLHVWPNAYKDHTTAFARQQLENGSVEFYFSEEKERGSISGLKFVSWGDSMLWQYHNLYKDIIELKLSKALAPNSSILIVSPFHVKLPKLFSRGGYNDSFFAVTQWYPKPAVYDVNGWNIMPYLDQGEFYSEFGDYVVDITVPAGFTMTATGNRNPLEQIGDGPKYRNRCVFSENNVHDFAWFVSNSFSIEERKISLNGKDSILLQVFDHYARNNDERIGVLSVLKEAVTEYSERVGLYPYKTCKVVLGDLISGGGMEYPTITVCINDNKETIIHEVGHNWFYGILGTNERRYPWMDESVNSYFDKVITHAGNATLCKDFEKDEKFYSENRTAKWIGNHTMLFTYLSIARQGLSQPVNLAAADFRGYNYGPMIYSKGPLLFAYLNEVLGDSVFSDCFKTYFKRWQFRHPLPGDMQKCFEDVSGVELDWFFKDLLSDNNNIDVMNGKNGLRVKGSPGLESLMKQKGIKIANPNGLLTEKNYYNNSKDGKLLSVKIPFGMPVFDRLVNLNLMPVAGWNYYDKFYFGAAFFNNLIFRNKLEFSILPAYSMVTRGWIGFGKVSLNLRVKSRLINQIITGVQGQSFSLSADFRENQYFRLNPYIKINMKHKGIENSRVEKYFLLNWYRTGLKQTRYFEKDSNKNSLAYNFSNTYFSNYCLLGFVVDNHHPVNRFALKANAEYGYNYKFDPMNNKYLKTWVRATYKYTYAKKNKYFRSDLFAGIFLSKKGNVEPQKFYVSGNNGGLDYLYSEAMLGRNENFFNTNDIIGRQIIVANGNMRNILQIAGTDKWMLTLNNEICLPGFIPFRIYFDIGYFQSMTNTNAQVVYNKAGIYTSGGIILPLFKNTLEIFAPLIMSSQYTANYKENFTHYLGFKLNLNQLNPVVLAGKLLVYNGTKLGDNL